MVSFCIAYFYPFFFPHSSKVIELAEVQTIDNYSNLLGDALHPNAVGMEKIAEKMTLVINNYYTKGVEYHK